MTGFDIPLAIQIENYRRYVYSAIQKVKDVLDDPDAVADLVKGGEERLIRNHGKYQSEMYNWGPVRARAEGNEELEDTLVYWAREEVA